MRSWARSTTCSSFRGFELTFVHFESLVVHQYARSYCTFDLREVTIEELDVGRTNQEARIVATVDEERNWVDAHTKKVWPRTTLILAQPWSTYSRSALKRRLLCLHEAHCLGVAGAAARRRKPEYLEEPTIY